jgi:hypothetical protein
MSGYALVGYEWVHWGGRWRLTLGSSVLSIPISISADWLLLRRMARRHPEYWELAYGGERC